jgi:hypothetical protein
VLRTEAEELREGGLALRGAAAEDGDIPRHLSQGAQDERPATKPSTRPPRCAHRAPTSLLVSAHLLEIAPENERDILGHARCRRSSGSHRSSQRYRRGACALRWMAPRRCPALLVALLLALPVPSRAQHPPRTTAASGASAACPCINPWDGWSSGTAAATFRGETVALAAGYGATSCSEWDDAVHPACSVAAASKPGWCQSKWCYVDASNCARPSMVDDTVWATATPSVVSGMDRSTLSVSYATCGFVSDYDDTRHLDTLVGSSYRVSFPGDSGSGYTLLTKPDGTKDGSVVQFMKDIKAVTGFSWTIHEVTDTSRTRYSSSFTACVHEVALGETDLCVSLTPARSHSNASHLACVPSSCAFTPRLGARVFTRSCIGNFWMTNERLLLTPFTGLLYTDEFKLILPVAPEVPLSVVMQMPLRPFTNLAWLYIVAVLMYMTIALNLITGAARYNVPMWQEWPTFTAATDYAMAKIGIAKKHIVVNAVDATVGRVLDATYCKIYTTAVVPHPLLLYGFCCADSVRVLCWCHTDAALSFTNGHVVQNGDASEQGGSGVPEKVVTVGFAMFGLIILTVYTASSAVALVVDAQAGTIKNMQDVIDSGGKICVRTAIEGMLISRYPEMLGRTYTHDQGPALLDAMDEGNCVATCLMADAWDNVLTQDSSPHCNKISVGEPLITAGNAMPVSKSLHQSISFIVSQNVAAGKYDKLREEYKTNLVGVPSCGEGADADAEGFQSLTELDLLAPLLITFMSTTVGLVLWCTCPSHTSKGRFSEAIHDKVYRGVMTDTQRDAKLKKELYWRPMSDLLYRAQAAGVDRQQAALAMNQAPDKTALVELVYSATCSEEGKDIGHLQSLPISSLISLIRAYSPDPETAGDVINSISAIDLRRAFRVVDRDDSGEVNAQELTHLFEALGSGMEVAPETANMISEADKNGDGEIGFSEFVKIVKKTKTPEWYDAAKLAAMAAALDEEHNVKGALLEVIVTRPEIRKLARTDLAALSSVAEANAAHSLKVSEFTADAQDIEYAASGPDASTQAEFDRLVARDAAAAAGTAAAAAAAAAAAGTTSGDADMLDDMVALNNFAAASDGPTSLPGSTGGGGGGGGGSSPRLPPLIPQPPSKEGASRPPERPGGLVPGKNAP